MRECAMYLANQTGRHELGHSKKLKKNFNRLYDKLERFKIEVELSGWMTLQIRSVVHICGVRQGLIGIHFCFSLN